MRSAAAQRASTQLAVQLAAAAIDAATAIVGYAAVAAGSCVIDLGKDLPTPFVEFHLKHLKHLSSKKLQEGRVGQLKIHREQCLHQYHLHCVQHQR